MNLGPRAILAILLLLLPGPRSPSQEPSAEPQGRQSPAAPPEIIDEASLLYSAQMPFDAEGNPLVTIGLMDAQKRVAVSSPDGLELTFANPPGEKPGPEPLVVPRGQRWSFVPKDAVAAEVAYWCAVESIPYSQRDQLERAIATWRPRADGLQVFEVGGVFGIQGHVIDNRTFIIGLRSYPREAEAQEACTRVFEEVGSKTFVHAHLKRRPSGLLRILDAAARERGRGLDLVKIRSRGQHPVTVYDVLHDQGTTWQGREDRRYSGEILVTFDARGTLAAVNRIDAERLLEGLVPAEIPASAPLEALKAQAVVARGEVFAKIGSRHFLDPFRLCASTHCQVYSGVGVERERTSRAVRATQGELLFLGPDLVDSVYSASCGGHTEDNEVVWSYPPSPALRGRPDVDPALVGPLLPVTAHLAEWLASSPKAFCNLSSKNRKDLFRWRRDFTAAEMTRLVAKTKPIGQVMAIQVLSRGVSGRVKVVRVVGTEGDLVVQWEWPIRQLFGNLKSGMFELTVETDQDQMPKVFHFEGGGWGHGVGMCQIGAIGRAEHGQSYREILGHYYGGAKVFRLYGSREKVDELDGNPLNWNDK